MTPAADMSAEDLWRMPDDGKRHELIRGKLTTLPYNDALHDCIAAEVSCILGNHVRAVMAHLAALGDARVPTDGRPSVRLPRDTQDGSRPRCL